jgi:hypothetical protein
MSADDRVKVLEGEFKLIKSELRQTLGSVRDFLLDLKIPQIQEEAIKQAQQNDVQNDQSGGGNGASGEADQSSQPESADESGLSGFESLPEPVQDAPAALELPEIPLESPVAEEQENASDGLNLLEDLDNDDSGITSGEMPGEQEPEDPVSKVEEAHNMKPDVMESTTQQVNLLANLIRWVSAAKKDIGVAQLSVFLDVYATTGNLAQETKETILHLAEVATDPAIETGTTEKTGMVTEEIAICMEINALAGQLPPEYKEKIRRLTELVLRQTVYANKADIWSQLLLELHGILTGGGTTLQPLGLLKNQVKEEGEETQAELDGEQGAESTGEGELDEQPEIEEVPISKSVKPARLRLVLPSNNGVEQELDLGSLFISTEAPEKPETPVKKNNGHKNIVSPKR